MVRLIKKLSYTALLLVLLGFSNRVMAEGSYLFYGVGPLLEMPGSIRFGMGNWEFGMLTSSAYGINKVIRAGQYTYFAFGPAIVPVGEVGLGFYGAVGLKGHLFWRLFYRVELNSVIANTGYTRGQGLMGLGFEF